MEIQSKRKKGRKEETRDGVKKEMRREREKREK